MTLIERLPKDQRLIEATADGVLWLPSVRKTRLFYAGVSWTLLKDGDREIFANSRHALIA